jgi:TatD DNase family protein
MTSPPPLDLHAHIDASIEPSELMALQAAVFAVTRSLDEASLALRRADSTTVWGVGCHPGLAGAQRSFSVERFVELIEGTPFVGEIGLDGNSRVPMETQLATFRSILEVLRSKPRISTIHSYAARDEALAAIAEIGPRGAVLHWWLGAPTETERAVELGCYFSVNASMLKRLDLLKAIPLERVLTETDHPFGDRGSKSVRRPGAVSDVEHVLADMYGVQVGTVRWQLWRNLRSLTSEVGVGAELPREFRRHLAAA